MNCCRLFAQAHENASRSCGVHPYQDIPILMRATTFDEHITPAIICERVLECLIISFVIFVRIFFRIGSISEHSQSHMPSPKQPDTNSEIDYS